jgi:hypothetical protein
MPMRLADILKETQTIDFEYGGEMAQIEFRINAITPQQSELIARMGELFRAGQAGDEDAGITLQQETELNQELIDVLLWLLVSWDVLGRTGKPVPITRNELKKLPSAFLYSLFGAIVGAHRPNAGSVGSSSSF